jgi:hypothetical protein
LSDRIVALRLSPKQAAFLQANLSQLAVTTRQAMTRPGLDPERHTALARRAVVLEITDDAVRSAMLEVPNRTRRSARGVESSARTRHGDAPLVARHGGEDARIVAEGRTQGTSSVLRVTPTATSRHNVPLPDGPRRDRVLRTRSNAWLSAFVGGRRDAG